MNSNDAHLNYLSGKRNLSCPSPALGSICLSFGTIDACFIVLQEVMGFSRYLLRTTVANVV